MGKVYIKMKDCSGYGHPHGSTIIVALLELINKEKQEGGTRLGAWVVTGDKRDHISSSYLLSPEH